MDGNDTSAVLNLLAGIQAQLAALATGQEQLRADVAVVKDCLQHHGMLEIEGAAPGAEGEAGAAAAQGLAAAQPAAAVQHPPHVALPAPMEAAGAAEDFDMAHADGLGGQEPLSGSPEPVVVEATSGRTQRAALLQGPPSDTAVGAAGAMAANRGPAPEAAEGAGAVAEAAAAAAAAPGDGTALARPARRLAPERMGAGAQAEAMGAEAAEEPEEAGGYPFDDEWEVHETLGHHEKFRLQALPACPPGGCCRQPPAASCQLPAGLMLVHARFRVPFGGDVQLHPACFCTVCVFQSLLLPGA